MRIAVVGTGHVGLATAATLAALGHEVMGVDEDKQKIDGLRRGEMPFFEAGLEDLVRETTASGALSFPDTLGEALEETRIAFICVGTPALPDGGTNLDAVEKAAEDLARAATGPLYVVQKSTVPVNTSSRLTETMSALSAHPIQLISNPEFLRQGKAVEDSMNPTRVLVGAETEDGHRVMREVYAPLIAKGIPYFATDLATAELAKHACNAFLALKISYANALARVCEAAGADVVTIADIMGTDPRIGRAFLDAGLGYGGYCFPKDVAAFRSQVQELGYSFGLLDEIQRINDEALVTAFEKVRSALWTIEGKRVALFGLSYKPGTDDIRESPALRLASKLLDAGCIVVGYDPMAAAAAAEAVPRLQIASDPYEAADGAHAVVLCTEWPEFSTLNLAHLKGILTEPVIVDCRNLYDPKSMAESGFIYIPTGRPAINR